MACKRKQISEWKGKFQIYYLNKKNYSKKIFKQNSYWWGTVSKREKCTHLGKSVGSSKKMLKPKQERLVIWKSIKWQTFRGFWNGDTHAAYRPGGIISINLQNWHNWTTSFDKRLWLFLPRATICFDSYIPGIFSNKCWRKLPEPYNPDEHQQRSLQK